MFRLFLKTGPMTKDMGVSAQLRSYTTVKELEGRMRSTLCRTVAGCDLPRAWAPNRTDVLCRERFQTNFEFFPTDGSFEVDLREIYDPYLFQDRTLSELENRVNQNSAVHDSHTPTITWLDRVLPERHEERVCLRAKNSMN